MVFRKFAFIAALALFYSVQASALTVKTPTGDCTFKGDVTSTVDECQQFIVFTKVEQKRAEETPGSSQWITPDCAEWSLAPETRGLSCIEAVKRFNAHVKESQESPADRHYERCRHQAIAYSQVAAYRDSGLFSPQAAADRLTAWAMGINDPMPAWGVKKLVNLVYFDTRFQGIGPGPMFDATLQICMRPESTYKPLQ